MAAKILLVLLFVITVAEAALLPVEWAAANKSISDAREKMRKAFDEVNAAATPDKKKKKSRLPQWSSHCRLLSFSMRPRMQDEKESC